MSDWLTYEAAAARFGISAEAVRQLAMRRKWPRRKPNDDPAGRIQVLIPDDVQIRPRTGVERPLDDRSTAELDALRFALDRERKRADQAEKARDAAIARTDAADTDRRAADARADAATQRADTAIALIDGFRAERDSAMARADRLEQALAAERSRADAVRERLDQAEGAAREADAQRRARGRLARAWRAWRGE